MPFTIQKLLNRLNPYLALEPGQSAGSWSHPTGFRPALGLLPRPAGKVDPPIVHPHGNAHASPGAGNHEGGTILQTLWETDYLGDTRSLDVHISWLRQAIEKDPRNPVYLRTERGVGYRLEVEKPTRPRNPKPETD